MPDHILHGKLIPEEVVLLWPKYGIQPFPDSYLVRWNRPCACLMGILLVESCRSFHYAHAAYKSNSAIGIHALIAHRTGLDVSYLQRIDDEFTTTCKGTGGEIRSRLGIGGGAFHVPY